MPRVTAMKSSMGTKLENISCVGEVAFVGISLILCNLVAVSGTPFPVPRRPLPTGHKKMRALAGFESLKGQLSASTATEKTSITVRHLRVLFTVLYKFLDASTPYENLRVGKTCDVTEVASSLQTSFIGSYSQLSDGDTVLCIPIEEQPSLSHLDSPNIQVRTNFSVLAQPYSCNVHLFRSFGTPWF